jgi:hypothetical protein
MYSKSISLALAFISCVLLYKHRIIGGFGSNSIYLMEGSEYLFPFFAVVLIWFGDVLGNYTGIPNSRIDNLSPGCLVKFFGWMFLIIPLIFFLFNK